MSDLNKNDTRIRTIRKDLGYTQEQFAEIMDMSISAFKRLDNGKTKLSIEKIYLLVERLNLSADYILYGKKLWENE